jgi:hypothetical protein
MFLLALIIPLGILLWLLSVLPADPVWNTPQAYAAGTVITVTNNFNSGGGSLRDAIETANGYSTSDPITITFDNSYTIALERALLLTRTDGPTYIQGNRGMESPQTVLNAEDLGKGHSALYVSGEQWHIQGLVVMSATQGFGVTIYGHDNRLSDSYIGLDAAGTAPRPNKTGILLRGGASHNIIDDNWIGGNRLHAISLYSSYYTPTQIITPSHHNTVTHNYIGTNPFGDELPNAFKGVMIQLGSHDNYVFDNIIAHNEDSGVYLYGGTENITGLEGVYPPVGNRIVSNTIKNNNQHFHKRYGAIVCDRTHRPVSNTIPTASSGFDNLIASNLITGNKAVGIYNIGASPLISANRIFNNQGYGIYNLVSFGSVTETKGYEDDILSIPYIVANTIDGNTGFGISSLDTAPARRYELTTALNNDIGSNSTKDVEQFWYIGVEVLTGTVDSTVPVTRQATVRIYNGDHSDFYDLSYNDEINESVIWGDDSEIVYEDATGWTQVREFSVDKAGTLQPWLTHTTQVSVNGVIGTVAFPFDGLTTTKPLSDVRLPNYQVTGPYARYQIAEVNFASDQDGDDIPDVVEGPVDSDNDGTPDWQEVDSDGDGIPDAIEVGDDPYNPVDTDGDGRPDYQDPDSDNDGIPDSKEYDADENGTPDDSDDDGIPDYRESNTNDADGDGTPDYLDEDADGDGISDDEEYDGCGESPCDADGDGIPDYLESNIRDTDGDGTPDYLDEDADGDDLSDSREGPYADEDDDGVPDYLENNHAPDESPPPDYSTDPDGDEETPRDDPDSDDDSIPDATEFYPQCEEGAELRDTDSDGVPNCADWDADGDGIPNFLDTDSDNDGVPDEDEGAEDANNNGVPDYLDPPYHIYLPLVVRAGS